MSLASGQNLPGCRPDAGKIADFDRKSAIKPLGGRGRNAAAETSIGVTSTSDKYRRYMSDRFNVDARAIGVNVRQEAGRELYVRNAGAR